MAEEGFRPKRLRPGAPATGASWLLAVAFASCAVAGAQSGVTTFSSVAVGSTSIQLPITVAAQSAGKVATVQVLTQGQSGLDFKAGSGGDTCTNSTLAVGATCAFPVSLTPTAPGLRVGAVVLLDNSSPANVLGTALVSGVGLGGLGVLVSSYDNGALIGPTVVTVAGDGSFSDPIVGDGLAATSAQLDTPFGVALDGAGNLYIADTYHNRIRMVTAPVATGTISTIAGGAAGPNASASPVYSGLASNALLSSPGGVTVDGAGNIFIADTGNNVIRKIVAATGLISTVAGNGTPTYSGDGAAAILASLNQPEGIAVDATGNLWIADTGNNVIREVTVDGLIKTVAGNGTAGFSGDNGPATRAQLYEPFAVAFDTNGKWYIADSSNFRVREVDLNGNITTIAGNGNEEITGDGQLATSVGLFAPSGLAIDPAGNIYISNRAKADFSTIRKVNEPSGIISTVANKTTTQIFGPVGVAIDGKGNLFFADTQEMYVKEILSNQILLDFAAVYQGAHSVTSTPQVVENDGNGPLELTAITPDPNFQVTQVPGVTNCSAGESLVIDDSCVVGVEFAPQLTPTLANETTESGEVDISDYVAGNQAGGNLPLAIQTKGNALPLSLTSIAFASPLPASPVYYGKALPVNVTITASGTLAGTVTFTDSSQSPATTVAQGVPVISGNTASLTLYGAVLSSWLAPGPHVLVACYVPAASENYKASCTNTPQGTPPVTALPLAFTVYEQTGTTLMATPQSPSASGGSITFAATVAALNNGPVAPTGTVAFSDGATLLSTVPLSASANGVAQYTTSTLSLGSHSITAVFTPASQYVLTSTGTITQSVQAGSTVSISPLNSSAVYGSPVTYNVAVMPTTSGPAATGTVDITFQAPNRQALTAACTPSATGWTYATSTLPAGSYNVTAQYSGDSNYAAGSATTTLTVALAPTSVQITPPATVIAGLPMAFTAIVTAAPTPPAFPVGTVTFTFTSGSTVLTSLPLNLSAGSGVNSASGIVTVTQVLPGALNSYSIVANYAPGATAGVTDFVASSQTISLPVLPLKPVVTITLPSTAPTVDTPVSFTVSVTGAGPTPAGTVVLNDVTDGQSSATPVTLSANGAATLPWPGFADGRTTYTLTASYNPGTDPNYLAATSASYSLTVLPVLTQTTLSVTPAGGLNVNPVVVASVTSLNPAFAKLISEGNVTFMSGTTQLGQPVAVQGGFATLPTASLPSGGGNVSAAYADGTPEVYGPSSSATLAVSGAAADFTMSLSSATLTLAPSQNAPITVTLSALNGFNEQMVFGCGGLPAGVTCTFTKNGTTITGPQTLSGTTPMLIGLNIDTNNPLSGGATAMNARAQSSRTTLAVLLWPFSLVFGALLWRFRKRHAMVTASLLILLLGGATMILNGCGGLTQTSAKAGTYPIQVVASGYLSSNGSISGSSNISHSETLTLTIQ